jgi:hypothetical protein
MMNMSDPEFLIELREKLMFVHGASIYEISRLTDIIDRLESEDRVDEVKTINYNIKINVDRTELDALVSDMYRISQALLDSEIDGIHI